MATSSSKSRQKFYESASRQIAILRKRPRLKRKHLIPMLADLFAGLLLILIEQDGGPNGKNTAK